MTRWAHLVAAFVALSAWAGAQGPGPAAPLSPEDKVRLLRENGALIESLVSDGVALSAADTPVKRAEFCRGAARALVNAVQHAATAGDAERVAELTGLFRALARDALAPTLEDAKRVVSAESPDGKRLRELRELAARDVTDLRAAIPATGTLPKSERVRAALKGLDEVSEALK